MGKNYLAWNLNLDQESGLLDFVRSAVLAPSSHNSQPWSFSISGNEVSITLDTARRLKESDKNDRQAIISIGCAISNMEIAADYCGYVCSVENSREGIPVILRFSRKGDAHKGDDGHLANFISKRVTNRYPHKKKPLDGEVVRSIYALASNSLRIDVITEQSLVRKLGVIAVDAGIDALEDSKFRLELSSYLRPNSTRSPVGMPGFGFGFPTPLAALAPTLIRFFNMEKPARKENIALFEKTTALLILSTPNDTPEDWLSVGYAYEHIALLATRAGMATAPWAATVQIGEHYREVQKILGITERPQFFSRIGFPTKNTKHSPRLTAGQVTL